MVWGLCSLAWLLNFEEVVGKEIEVCAVRAGWTTVDRGTRSVLLREKRQKKRENRKLKKERRYIRSRAR